MVWPLPQPDTALEATWRASVRDVLPSEGELGWAEGRDIHWIHERVTTPAFSTEWLLGRMVEDGELTAQQHGDRLYYRKTGAFTPEGLIPPAYPDGDLPRATLRVLPDGSSAEFTNATFIEIRTDDPVDPEEGRIWLRIDL